MKVWSTRHCYQLIGVVFLEKRTVSLALVAAAGRQMLLLLLLPARLLFCQSDF